VPILLADRAEKEAKKFSEKIMVFSRFVTTVLAIDKISPCARPRKTAFHSPCHLGRGLGIKEDPIQIIQQTGHLYVPTAEEETCCGFGGSFSANFPAVSKEILHRKLDDVETSGADLLVTECPGCVMQLRGGALMQNKNIDVKHLSEIIQVSDG
jgi:Fe-S oxidoreductase